MILINITPASSKIIKTVILYKDDINHYYLSIYQYMNFGTNVSYITDVKLHKKV